MKRNEKIDKILAPFGEIFISILLFICGPFGLIYTIVKDFDISNLIASILITIVYFVRSYIFYTGYKELETEHNTRIAKENEKHNITKN